MEMKSKKIFIYAHTFAGKQINTNYTYYVDLRLDDLNGRLYGMDAPRAILKVRSIEISQNLAAMDIPASLTIVNLYNAATDQKEWHVWLKTTDVGWVTYQIEGGGFI